MPRLRLSNVTGNQREWFLPVMLFFVAVFAIARAILESGRDPGARYLLVPIGFLPTMAALVAVAGVAVAWYFQGSLRHPLRKVLAVALVALPLAAFLTAVQDKAAASPAGGRMGALLAHPFTLLPAVLGVGFIALLLGFSAWLAFRIAFLGDAGTQSSPEAAAVFAGAMAPQPSRFRWSDEDEEEEPALEQAAIAVAETAPLADGIEEVEIPAPEAAEPEPAIEAVEIGDIPPHLLGRMAAAVAGDLAEEDEATTDEAGLDSEEEFDEFREDEPARVLEGVGVQDDEDEAAPFLELAEKGDASAAPGDEPRWEALERLERALEERQAESLPVGLYEPGSEQGDDAEIDGDGEDTAEMRAPAAAIAGEPDAGETLEGEPATVEVGEEDTWEDADEAALDEEIDEPATLGLKLPLPGSEPAVVFPKLRLRAEASVPPEPEVASDAADPSTAAVASRTDADWAAWEEPRPSKPAARSSVRALPRISAEDQQVLFGTEVDETTYRRAVDLVVAEERCSVSLLQRRLQVSWSEANAMIERMHDDGIVGPPLPSGRRDVVGAEARAEADVGEV